MAIVDVRTINDRRIIKPSVARVHVVSVGEGRRENLCPLNARCK